MCLYIYAWLCGLLVFFSRIVKMSQATATGSLGGLIIEYAHMNGEYVGLSPGQIEPLQTLRDIAALLPWQPLTREGLYP